MEALLQDQGVFFASVVFQVFFVLKAYETQATFAFL